MASVKVYIKLKAIEAYLKSITEEDIQLTSDIEEAKTYLTPPQAVPDLAKVRKLEPAAYIHHIVQK